MEIHSNVVYLLSVGKGRGEIESTQERRGETESTQELKAKKCEEKKCGVSS